MGREKVLLIRKIYDGYLLALHLRLALVERHIALDFIHALQRFRVVPRRVFDFGLVRGYCVVARIALVGAVRLCGSGAEVRGLDCVGREVNVPIDYLPLIGLSDHDAIHSSGCVGHRAGIQTLKAVKVDVEEQSN